jgi:hypothetical protein
LYRLQKGPPEFHVLCTDKDPVDPETQKAGMGLTLALVFTGDRYDANKKTVTAGKSDWFNVACAGSAIAKMHLLRHTTAGAAGGLQTTVDQRQAMLKMLTDDICGTGYSFTKDGEDVYYTDVRDWHPPVPAGSTLPTNARVEAIWSKDGAICLDEPRRYVENPLVVDAIKQECQKTKLPPACSTPGATKVGLPGLPPGQPAYDLQNWKSANAYGISANPP